MRQAIHETKAVSRAMTAIHAVARRHSISSQNVVEILATMEIMSGDRLAEIFGISEHTAIRYAVNARQLTGLGGASASTPDTVTLDYAGTAGP